MRIFVGIASLLLIVGGLDLSAAMLAQARPQESLPLQSSERFSGTTSIRAKDGRASELRVAVRNWSIGSGSVVARFPEQGPMVVHVLAGRVSAVVDGKQQEYKEGDFWAVPAGQTLSIEVKGETATLQTITIRKP